MEQARGIEEAVHIAEQIFDVIDNAQCPIWFSSVGAGLGCLGDAGGLIEALADAFEEISHRNDGRLLGHDALHTGPLTLWVREKSSRM